MKELIQTIKVMRVKTKVVKELCQAVKVAMKIPMTFLKFQMSEYF